MVSTLSYVSTLHGSVGRSELDTLLETSRDRNAKVGITGLLLVRDRRVMQILEGEQAQVRALYARIRQDPRHRDVTEVWSSSGMSRRFPAWSMGFEDLEVARTDLGTEDLADRHGEPHAPLDADQRTFLNRRMVLLRRGFANGNRLISALAVILDAHDVDMTWTDDGSPRLKCHQGCVVDELEAPGYPCATARHAFYALDASF